MYTTHIFIRQCYCYSTKCTPIHTLLLSIHAGFSGHILSKVELQVLNSLLSAYSNDKVKKVQISVQNKPNITLEEVEITLRQNGLISIGNSLKENINKGMLVWYVDGG